MSVVRENADWWLHSDGKWYPPETAVVHLSKSDPPVPDTPIELGQLAYETTLRIMDIQAAQRDRVRGRVSALLGLVFTALTFGGGLLANGTAQDDMDGGFWTTVIVAIALLAAILLVSASVLSSKRFLWRFEGAWRTVHKDKFVDEAALRQWSWKMWMRGEVMLDKYGDSASLDIAYRRMARSGQSALEQNTALLSLLNAYYITLWVLSVTEIGVWICLVIWKT